MTKKIIEYGHYYQNQGPTLGTIQSISVFNKLKNQGFFGDNILTVLFVDDIHENNPHEPYGELYQVDFDSLSFDMKVLESRTKIAALQLIQLLQQDQELDTFEEGGKKYLRRGSKYKIEIFDGKNPSCVMMDAALTLLKMGNKTGPGEKVIINVLPSSYKQQQQNLHKVITELFRIGVVKESIHLQSLLFDSESLTYELIKTIHSSAKKEVFVL